MTLLWKREHKKHEKRKMNEWTYRRAVIVLLEATPCITKSVPWKFSTRLLNFTSRRSCAKERQRAPLERTAMRTAGRASTTALHWPRRTGRTCDTCAWPPCFLIVASAAGLSTSYRQEKTEKKLCMSVCIVICTTCDPQKRIQTLASSELLHWR